MNDDTRSLLTLLALIFGSIVLFVGVMLWWLRDALADPFDVEGNHE